MTSTGKKMELNPAIIDQLEKGGLWTAAHQDGSDNRVNADAIGDAASVGTSLGVLTAVFQFGRKAFRNRNKTREDLVAEKEAVGINATCESLNLLLRDYLRDAAEGRIEEDDLDTLMDTLKRMEEYDQAGKLLVPGKAVLTAVAGSIAKYTAALTGDPAQAPGANLFGFIREQLTRQKKVLG